MKNPELKFSIHAAAGVFRDRIVRETIGSESLAPAHNVNKWPPFSVIHAEAWSEEQVIFLDSLPIETAAIEHDADVRVMLKRKVFEGRVPSAKSVAVGGDDIDAILVGNADIDIATGKDLRLRRSYQQHGTQQCQHKGCNF